MAQQVRILRIVFLDSVRMRTTFADSEKEVRMTEQRKRDWVTPQATRYGSVKEITLQVKNKTFGAGDDVLVNNQSILSNAGS